MHEDFKNEFLRDLSPLMTEWRLEPVWHFEGALLRLQPIEGSASATLCFSFPKGFWDDYAALDEWYRERTRLGAVTSAAIYNPASKAREAQDVHVILARAE